MTMRDRPRAENGKERLEEIRHILGMNMGEFSLAMGFKTENGYSATIRGPVALAHLLIGEGLLALKKPNGHEPPKKYMLLTIDGNGAVESRPLTDAKDMIFNGEKFLVLKQGVE
jgi:hypothetical protein